MFVSIMKTHHHTDERLLIEQFVQSGKSSAEKLFDDAQALRSHLDAGFRVSTHQFMQAMSSQESRARDVEERAALMEKLASEQTSLKEMVNTVFVAYEQQLKDTRVIEEHLKNYGYQEVYHDLPPQFPEGLVGTMESSEAMKGVEEVAEEVRSVFSFMCRSFWAREGAHWRTWHWDTVVEWCRAHRKCLQRVVV